MDESLKRVDPVFLFKAGVTYSVTQTWLGQVWPKV
jgi:hypothetical protein